MGKKDSLSVKERLKVKLKKEPHVGNMPQAKTNLIYKQRDSISSQKQTISSQKTKIDSLETEIIKLKLEIKKKKNEK